MNEYRTTDGERAAGFALFLLLLFGAAMLAKCAVPPHAHYRHHGPALLPDLDVTPGLVRTTDKNADGVCRGTTKPYRKAGVQAVYGIYGAVKSPGKYEIDHLISLELGGDNGVENEWPQPYEPRPGAHEKDKVENWLNAQVCSGKMELKEAQRRIATDWYAVYIEMNKLPRGTDGARLGPEHWQCDISNDCDLVQNKLSADGKPELSPLGCFLAKTRITWILGDRTSMCVKSGAN